MPGLRLTPSQACRVFGWLGAKPKLTWDDVVQNEHIHFESLLNARLTPDQLYTLQPDILSWIAHGKINKTHLSLLPSHWQTPALLTHFRIDIGDLANMRLTAEKMLQLGINYETLKGMGLTGENMRLFKTITVTGWALLGMKRSDASELSEANLYACFGLRKIDVLAALSAK